MHIYVRPQGLCGQRGCTEIDEDWIHVNFGWSRLVCIREDSAHWGPTFGGAGAGQSVPGDTQAVGARLGYVGGHFYCGRYGMGVQAVEFYSDLYQEARQGVKYILDVGYMITNILSCNKIS